MADVDVNLDSSDLPLIVEALELLRRELNEREQHHAGDAQPADEHPTIVQLDLLINTFRTVRAA
jgi:hypothetical protein